MRVVGFFLRFIFWAQWPKPPGIGHNFGAHLANVGSSSLRASSSATWTHNSSSVAIASRTGESRSTVKARERQGGRCEGESAAIHQRDAHRERGNLR